MDWWGFYNIRKDKGRHLRFIITCIPRFLLAQAPSLTNFHVQFYSGVLQLTQVGKRVDITKAPAAGSRISGLEATSKLILEIDGTPMEILSVEPLSDEALRDLRRHARLERKRKRQRLLTLTGSDVLKILAADISQLRAIAPNDAGKVLEEGSALPRLSDDQVGKHEDREGVALLVFARDVGKPVMARLDCQPSKRFENGLRQSAKIRDLTLRFFRLIDNYVAVDVHTKPTPSESDVNFLKTLGINGT